MQVYSQYSHSGRESCSSRKIYFKQAVRDEIKLFSVEWRSLLTAITVDNYYKLSPKKSFRYRAVIREGEREINLTHAIKSVYLIPFLRMRMFSFFSFENLYRFLITRFAKALYETNTYPIAGVCYT